LYVNKKRFFTSKKLHKDDYLGEGAHNLHIIVQADYINEDKRKKSVYDEFLIVLGIYIWVQSLKNVDKITKQKERT
jgi:hypothetical protein